MVLKVLVPIAAQMVGPFWRGFLLLGLGAGFLVVLAEGVVPVVGLG